MASLRHTRSVSDDSSGRRRVSSPDSPLPSQTHHPTILPRSVPTPALLESVAGGAHYAGVRMDSDTVLKQRRSSQDRHNHTEIKHDHQRIMHDLQELYCCRPTLEIFKRSWCKDAVFEVSLNCPLHSHAYNNSRRILCVSAKATPSTLLRYVSIFSYSDAWLTRHASGLLW